MEANMSKSTTQRLFGWSQCPHLVLMPAFVKQAVVLEARLWSTGLHFKVRTKALIQESLNLMNSHQGPGARRYRLVFRIRWDGKVGGFNQSFEQSYRWQTTHSYLAKIDQAWNKGPSLPPCKGIRIPESGTVLPVESGILGFGIRNASSTDKEFGIQHLESEIQGIESRIQDCLGFPYMGRLAET